MGHSFLHHQLASVLSSSEDASRLQIIVAPTTGAALSLRTAAARMDVPLVNVEAVTVPGLALHVWRSMRPFEAGRLASRDQMVLVLAAAIRSLPEREADLFRPSLARIASGIESDRIAGRGGAWARESARSPIQRAYADLFDAYETYLANQSLFDMADVNRQAVALSPDFCKERLLDALLVCCETPILPVQKPLLDTLGQAAESRLLLGNSALVASLEGPWACSVLNDWAFAEPAAPDLVPKPAVLHAATRRDEVWRVLSDIIARSIPFDDVEIVVSDRETYQPLIDAACRRLGIPSTLEVGTKSGEYALKAAISDYLQWVSSGYQSRHLADLLRNPAFTMDDPSGISAHTMADLLSRFQLTPAVLSRPDLEEILEEGARRERISRKHLRQMVSWMHSFRDFVPEALVLPDRFAGVLRRLVDKHLEQGGSELIEKLCEAPERGYSKRVEAKWLAAFLNDKLRERQASQDFGNGLHVSSWDEAGYGPRHHAFVLGLDDQASGSQPGDDASHVAGLEASRPNGYGRPIPARRRLHDLLLRFGERLTTALPAWDIRASRGLFPGSALVGAAGIEEVVAERRTSRLDRADAERQDPGRTQGSFMGVERGMLGQLERHAPHWSAWDGQTGLQEGPISVRLSPSRMEQYLACPYRYFLSSILGIDGQSEDDDEEWMDRAAEGNILHDLFEEHTRSRVRSEAGIDPVDEQHMLGQLGQALERQAARAGVAPEAFLEARFREMAHGVHRYFERERRLAGERRPMHAEFSFSDRPEADGPPAMYQNADGDITLTGRVDRIDETEAGEWIIVDYKTGKPEGYLPDKLQKMDDKLQWALYAWAINQVSDKTVSASEYVFTSRVGAGWTSRVATPASDQVAPLFDSVLQRIKSGHFIPAPDEQNTCTWCDFKAVCGDLGERRAAIHSKFASADPDETRAFEGWKIRDKNIPSS